jgi:glycosyltransferase involved in cell wall biosynthesis
MTKQLRVAMVAPPWFPVPPPAYGGIEAVVGDLTRALSARGCQVTLIGAGRDGTPAEFLRTYAEPPSQRLGESGPDLVHAAAAARLLAELEVDVVHDHSAAGPLTANGQRVPTVVTVHGPVDGELGEYYRQLGDAVSLVAISHAQRELAADLNWVATVYNCIDVAEYPVRESKEDWVLFLGRFNEEKSPHLAIEAARAAGRPIVLAGKVNEAAEQEYFDERIRPCLGDDVQYVGQADAATKRDLYARAACLLFPVQWPEPFGMVMIEAMACGTPVVALGQGSVPEVVADGVTGVICQSADELADGIKRAAALNPADCRAHVERHFDLPVMARDYEAVYKKVIAAVR